MITVTRLDGQRLLVNPDLVERIESSHDTVLTFVDGNRLVVSEAPDDLVERIVDFRARSLVVAERLFREDPSAGFVVDQRPSRDRRDAKRSMGGLTVISGRQEVD